jgi:nucleotide-binding universal stress UspA family protein
MALFKKILVPVDGSSTSNKALEWALKMAKEAGAQVRLLHSIDELSYLSGYEYSGEMIKMARDQAERTLIEGQQAAKAAGVACDTRLIDSAGQRLGDTVADAARDWSADLVVVGTHGRRGVGRVLLGSGAEQVIRCASVPVLIVRHA